MPAMRFMRPFTTRVVNPITRPFAGRLPGFGILSYVGRRSGRRYRTPINVFRHGQDYVVALTYGSDVDWVKNVVAAGGCELETMGRSVHLTDPRLFVDPRQRLMRVTEFLSLRAEPTR